MSEEKLEAEWEGIEGKGRCPPPVQEEERGGMGGWEAREGRREEGLACARRSWKRRWKRSGGGNDRREWKTGKWKGSRRSVGGTRPKRRLALGRQRPPEAPPMLGTSGER